MTRRVGEMTKGDINRGYPFQVAVIQPEQGYFESYKARAAFCESLSLCMRGHHFRRDDRDWNVFCFADKSHADMFKAEFDGKYFDPKGKGANWWQVQGM